MTLEKLQDKSSVAAVSFTSEDLSLLQKVKRHLSTCDCCRKAILEEICDKIND